MRQIIVYQEDGETFTGTTDASGRYHLGGLESGQWYVQAGHQELGYLPSDPVSVDVTAPQSVIRHIELVLGASLTGVITSPGGATVAGATVTAQMSEGSYGSTVTDEDGRYDIHGLADGIHTILVEAVALLPSNWTQFPLFWARPTPWTSNSTWE